MDAQAIVSLITNIGFPIVCVMFLWKYINTTLAELQKTLQENTCMLEKMCYILDADKDKRLDDAK